MGLFSNIGGTEKTSLFSGVGKKNTLNFPNPLRDLGVSPLSNYDPTEATKPNIKVSVGDVAKELPVGIEKTVEGIHNLVIESGQSALRAYASLGAAISKKLDLAETSQFTPQGQFQEDLFGKKESFGFREVGEEIPGLEGNMVAPVAGFAVATSDLIPGGNATKQTVVNSLKNINKADEAAKLLSKLLGVSKKVAAKYAPDAAKLNDVKELSLLVDKVVHESQSIGELGKRTAGTVKDVAVKTKDMIKGFFKREPPFGLLQEMERFVDYARIGKLPDEYTDKFAYEADYRDAVGSFGLDPNLPNGQLANLSEEALIESQKIPRYIQDEKGKMAGSTKKPEIFEGFTDLSLRTLEKLKGKSTVSRQFIEDLSNQPDLKQGERDVIRQFLKNEGETVNVSDFANKVKGELLPLERTESRFFRKDVKGNVKSWAGGEWSPKYEGVALPDELRGRVESYKENIYQSPINTSAGDVHFSGNSKNYFGHTRVEDMADDQTRRVIEVQSDLYQKGNIDKETLGYSSVDDFNRDYPDQNFSKAEREQVKNAQKLKQYNDPTAHFRMIREEVKKAAQDGKTKLQFPTGETAMKIEGLGDTGRWMTWDISRGGYQADLTPQKLEVGLTVSSPGNEKWIITDVLGDGKFKAVSRDMIDSSEDFLTSIGYDFPDDAIAAMGKDKRIRDYFSNSLMDEEFDISGKVDTSNPIYKFYEKDVGKYLKNKYNAQLVEDAQGVKWWEVKVDPRIKNTPVEAFGGVAGFEKDDEGNLIYDPEQGAMGLLAMVGYTKAKGSEKGKRVMEYFAETLDPTNPNPKNAGVFVQFRKTMENTWTGFKEMFVDDFARVRELAKEKGLKMDDFNPIDAKIRFYGRVGSRIEGIKDEVRLVDKELLTSAKRAKVPDATLQKDVNDYLIAKHAPERNAVHGDGAAGMTTEEALNRAKEIETQPYFSEVKKVSDMIVSMNARVLETLYNGQVITKEQYDTLRQTYKNHVPLQRIFEESENVFDVLSGRGFDVKGTGLKKAKGSEREVADILTNVAANLEQATIRAEKNLVDLATYKLYKENEEALSGIVKEYTPKAIGRSFGIGDRVEELSGAIDDFVPSTDDVSNASEVIGQAEMEVLAQLEMAQAGTRVTKADGSVVASSSTFPKFVPEHLRSRELFNQVTELYNKGKLPPPNATRQRELLDVIQNEITSRVPEYIQDELVLTEIAKQSETKASLITKFGKEGRVIYETITDPNILSFKVEGKPKYLKFEDPHLAAAFRGVNRMKQDGLFRIIGSFTRLYASLMTRFNPEFFIPNKIRDLQETSVYLASQGDFGFKGTAAMFTKQAKMEGERAVFGYLRGVDSADTRLYKQMIEDGGTTGGLGLSTRKQVELDVESIRKMNRSKPREAAKFVLEKIDELNQVFEDSTRFMVYRQALKQGLPRERAAVLAKEASIDFNRMGTGGPIVNSLYMFANASIQGSAKMLRSMKDPKVAGTVLTAVGGSVWAVNEWNDRIDPDWRDKITKWDRINSLNVMYPTSEGVTYFSIPVSWGMKPIKVAMEYASDLAAGKASDSKEAVASIFQAAVESYNPVGGTDVLSATLPTILDLPVAIAKNKSWTGSSIYPDYDKNAPDSIKYFSSLEEGAEGKAAIKLTEKLAERGIEISPAVLKYAFEQMIGGTGRFVSKTANTLNGFAEGNVEIDQIPFVSRFVRMRSDEEIGEGEKTREELKDILTEQSRERFKKNKMAETIDLELSQLPKEAANARMKEIKMEDESLFNAIVDAKNDRELGLTSTDRLIKQLGVENGERAKYIHAQAMKLETPEERNLYIAELKKKKLLSKEVIDQLKALKQDDVD